MTNCQQCNTALVGEGISQGQQVRCARCSHLFRLGDQASSSADKFAWRSFWLGLISFVFLFLTGLPAIYYGVKSLLRSRFIQARPIDKAAAVAGTAMGGCFGILGGFTLLISCALAAVVFFTISKLEDPAEIQQRYSTLFAEVLEDLHPEESVSVFNAQFFFEFADAEQFEERTFRLRQAFARAPMQATKGQTVSQLKSLGIDRNLLLEEISAEKLTWNLHGEEISVMKTVSKIIGYDNSDNDENQPEVDESQPGKLVPPISADSNAPNPETTVQYVGYVKQANRSSGFSAVVYQPNNVYTEEKIKAIIERIQFRDE